MEKFFADAAPYIFVGSLGAIGWLIIQLWTLKIEMAVYSKLHTIGERDRGKLEKDVSALHDRVDDLEKKNN